MWDLKVGLLGIDRLCREEELRAVQNASPAYGWSRIATPDKPGLKSKTRPTFSLKSKTPPALSAGTAGLQRKTRPTFFR